MQLPSGNQILRLNITKTGDLQLTVLQLPVLILLKYFGKY
jgi:hypothetical protein